ncbi:MAG: alanine--tRNA ligase, partial [Pseudomonadota bacterium]
DTGMGLERVAAVMQGVHSNYEIDLFATLISDIASALNVADLDSKSLRVIADHIRACSFLIVDGVLPGNEGRGYVLRRIIRRAIRHGHKLGVKKAFFSELVGPLCKVMGEAYPELTDARAHVEKILAKEESRFAETLNQGLGLLAGSIAELKGTVIPGDIAFRLYDTYGFPVDLTADIARERGLSVDQAGFDAAMGEQKAKAKAASNFAKAGDAGLSVEHSSEFSGYEHDSGEACVLGLYIDGQAVKVLESGNEGVVVLDQTPFYGESGGQVGDSGTLSSDAAEFSVRDTQKSGDAHLHIGKLRRGELKIGDTVTATVDAARRNSTRRNHSATHLMHAALRDVLGDHVHQKGSLVDPERLRFDFSHFDPVSAEELARIEAIVNREILANIEADTRLMSFDDAVESGAMALFGEKYDDKVRVLSLGSYSVELCGGTHVARTGDIGLFKIVSEGGVAAGVRRIEALTGEGALAYVRDGERLLGDIGHAVKGNRENSLRKIEQLQSKNRSLEKELAELKRRLATGGAGSDPLEPAVAVGDTRLLCWQLDVIDASTLRSSVDQFKDRLGSGVVVIGSAEADKVRLACGVSKDLVGKIKAGDLIRNVAEIVGGKGGGRPDFAQAGGTDPARLQEALDSVQPWLSSALNNKS